jgi:uracil-DNA glycosylase
MLRELFYEVDESWKKELMGEFAKPYMISLSQFLDSAYINLPNPTSSRSVYPPLSHVFSAFKYTPLSQIKVVIVGQDPYHGVDQAHGLAFCN